MILTCPSCATQYVVKDGAIPPLGRQVRCASCKHSWHQDPEETATTESIDEPGSSRGDDAPAEARVTDEVPAFDPAEESFDDEPDSVAEATLIEPRSGPEAEERAYEEAALDEYPPSPDTNDEAMAAAGFTGVDERRTPREAEAQSDWREPPQPEAVSDEFSPFPVFEEEPPRKRSGIVRFLVIVIVVAALAAAFWFLAPPQWKALLGLSNAASPLALVTTHMDRQRLESGNELLTVTGRVINPTQSEQPVPPLQAQLKSRSGQVVYRWTIAPPARTLSPGASASFNSAEVNVPPGGEELTISLSGQKA